MVADVSQPVRELAADCRERIERVAAAGGGGRNGESLTPQVKVGADSNHYLGTTTVPYQTDASGRLALVVTVQGRSKEDELHVRNGIILLITIVISTSSPSLCLYGP